MATAAYRHHHPRSKQCRSFRRMSPPVHRGRHLRPSLTRAHTHKHTLFAAILVSLLVHYLSRRLSLSIYLSIYLFLHNVYLTSFSCFRQWTRCTNSKDNTRREAGKHASSMRFPHRHFSLEPSPFTLSLSRFIMASASAGELVREWSVAARTRINTLNGKTLKQWNSTADGGNRVVE